MEQRGRGYHSFSSLGSSYDSFIILEHGVGGGGGIFRGKQRGDQSSLTGLQGSKAVLYCEND